MGIEWSFGFVIIMMIVWGSVGAVATPPIYGDKCTERRAAIFVGFSIGAASSLAAMLLGYLISKQDGFNTIGGLIALFGSLAGLGSLWYFTPAIGEVRTNITGYLFISPARAIIAVFGFFPIGYAVYMSFWRWRVRQGEWRGPLHA